jgi:hypothetical protein
MPVYPGAHNEHRPHRALEQRPPLNQPPPLGQRPVGGVIDLKHVRRRDLLGGLIHEYRVAA